MTSLNRNILSTDMWTLPLYFRWSFPHHVQCSSGEQHEPLTGSGELPKLRRLLDCWCQCSIFKWTSDRCLLCETLKDTGILKECTNWTHSLAHMTKWNTVYNNSKKTYFVIVVMILLWSELLKPYLYQCQRHKSIICWVRFNDFKLIDAIWCQTSC